MFVFIIGNRMQKLCLISSCIGFFYFLFGIFCLAAPFFFSYDPAYDNIGAFALDQIGVFATIAGALLWGMSLNALAIFSKNV